MIGVIALAVFSLGRDGAGESDGDRDQNRKLNVVTTFFPLYDFTRAVGGDRVQIELLFSQTPEVASFSPSDILRINRADLVVKNGIGLEAVLDDLISSSDNRDVWVVDTSEGIQLLDSFERIEVEGSEVKEEHGHGLRDPHIWLDPQHAMIQIGHIRDAFVTLDPAHADEYAARAQNLLGELVFLDQEIANAAAQFRKKDFIAFHSAFQYFAKRYGLNQAAVIEEFPGKDPSPGYLAGVARIVGELGIVVIFVEPQFSPKVAEVIARDLGLQVRVLDPIETGDPLRDSYISLMRKNLDVLTEAMR